MRYAETIVNEDGWSDWILPQREGYKIRCCDCGLVHVFDFTIHKGRIYYRARRDNRATAASRRKK